MIEASRPELLVMTGIAAGVRNSCEIGDVIVADPSWD
jgi:nucleoside phosphorylase